MGVVEEYFPVISKHFHSRRHSKRSGARDVVFWKVAEALLERENDQSSELILSCCRSPAISLVLSPTT